MKTNNHKIVDYSAQLDQEFGRPGTPERNKFDEDAYNFYIGLILHKSRKEAKVTQAELAEKTHTSKSYISRIENGSINPSAGMFYRLIHALGYKIEISL
ncbi:MAG: helix-turn-helix domain-containing protein [Bacteroides sp.]|nr:helix-turn-helix domain-containing protein [Ruminococcus flavefaciens]MCM1555538.1 helix-turn-helix domain-containing protein [Bacteroides sp.]